MLLGVVWGRRPPASRGSGLASGAAVAGGQRRGSAVAVMSAEALTQFLADSFPDAPPGYVVEAAGDEEVVLRLPVERVLRRPGGTVSGPTLMALADATAWVAVLCQIGPVALSVTTSLHIDFLRRPAVADLEATGRLLKLGRRLAVADVELRSAGGSELVAKAQVTYSIPPR